MWIKEIHIPNEDIVRYQNDSIMFQPAGSNIVQQLRTCITFHRLCTEQDFLFYQLFAKDDSRLSLKKNVEEVCSPFINSCVSFTFLKNDRCVLHISDGEVLCSTPTFDQIHNSFFFIRRVNKESLDEICLESWNMPNTYIVYDAHTNKVYMKQIQETTYNPKWKLIQNIETHTFAIAVASPDKDLYLTKLPDPCLYTRLVEYDIQNPPLFRIQSQMVHIPSKLVNVVVHIVVEGIVEYMLRHKYGIFYVEQLDSSVSDFQFVLKPMLNGGIVFQSVNFPDRYLSYHEPSNRCQLEDSQSPYIYWKVSPSRNHMGFSFHFDSNTPSISNKLFTVSTLGDVFLDSPGSKHIQTFQIRTV